MSTLEGKDPNVDDVKPVVTAPADVATGATGALTKVDLGEATASDALRWGSHASR